MAHQQEDSYNLAGLGKEEVSISDPFRDVRGRQVFDKNGTEIGLVEELYVERDSGEPRLMNVGSGGGMFGGSKRNFLLPFETIRDVGGSEELGLELDIERIMRAPTFELADEAPDAHQQRSIYAYYG